MAEESNVTKPGHGGWVPKKRTPLWAALFVGIVGSSAPALMIALPSPWNAVVGSSLLGAAATLATYFGMKSAGPRQP